MSLPALRCLDAIPLEHEGEPYICLSDPQGYVEEQVLLSPIAYFVASMLDGRNGHEEIRQHFINHFGRDLLTSNDIDKVVSKLDEEGFLNTKRFFSLQHEVDQRFAESPVRPAYLADRSYPGNSADLREFLDACFRDSGLALPRPAAQESHTLPLRGLIVPHIDFQRGGAAYAHGYSRLYQKGRPEAVLVFGVAHAAPPAPFILTRKPFETPFGNVPNAVEIVDELAEACSWDPFAYEGVHRTEHSIEFQAVMLAYFYGSNTPIVPVLCSQFIPEFRSEEGDEKDGAEAFLNRCAEIVLRYDGRIAVIAGADLAHVGQRFGDAFEITEPVIEAVRERDREDLEHTLSTDAKGFYSSVMKDDNERRVCGLNCIYSALRALDGAHSEPQSELVHYDYAHDPAGGIVSFANVVIS